MGRFFNPNEQAQEIGGAFNSNVSKIFCLIVCKDKNACNSLENKLKKSKREFLDLCKAAQEHAKNITQSNTRSISFDVGVYQSVRIKIRALG